MIVGLVCYKKELGASIGYIKALFALKTIYQAHVIVFGNSLTKNLFQHCEYIDESLDMGNMETQDTKEQQRAIINQYRCHYLIATTTNSSFISFLLSSNAKTIICATKLYSFFSLRCKTVPIYFFKKYRNMRHEDIMLHFVKKINPRLFHQQIANLDSVKYALHASKDNEENIHQFLLSALQKYALDSQPYLILINPFNINNCFSLTMPYWLQLIEEVAKISLCIPLVVTYPQVQTQFMQQLKQSQRDLQKLLLFPNNDCILNLVALMQMVSCVISPSTGTIHVASNLNIPTIGLYAEWDTGRWGTKDNRYIFINKAKHELDSQSQMHVINDVILTLKNMIEKQQIKPISNTLLQSALHSK
ncbi:lipopolysaccharide heptosyltransferase family protein [Helicobacter aurati]|uniref:Lipopolysaccharide heptosyltransferase family protein n=1 Tax=Helicobacter aurati TaxID=137778 RepID=A0A3D8J676_9HELI|nr:glycosyltransferase family 9 protein [Helicobacter aurati]RDU72932.1 lipopolysaccharide heptosyltransferase family protein [Helicobacter aurati]